MSIQTIKGGLYIPQPLGLTSFVFLTNRLLNAANEYVAHVTEAPADGSIEKVGFRAGNITATGNVDVRLETVSNGDPTGTLLGTNSNKVITLTNGVDDFTWITATLTTPVTVSKGDKIAMKILYSTGGHNIAIAMTSTNAMYPYTVYDNGALVRHDEHAIMALEYAGGVYHRIQNCEPIATLLESQYRTGTSPDEKGIKFKLPFRYRVTGCFLRGYSTSTDFDLKLYDSDGTTVLTTTSIDGEAQAGSVVQGYGFFLFDTEVILQPDTFYRLTKLPTEDSFTEIFGYEVDSVAIMDATDGGQDFHATERTDAGAWTDLTDRHWFMGLIIDGIDTGYPLAGGANLSGNLQC